MEITYKDIQGWFSDLDAAFVSSIVQSISNGHVVEIGLYKGRSSAVMMPIAIKNNNMYYSVDNFFGGINDQTPASKDQRANGTQIMQEYIENMKKIGMSRSDYILWRINSIEASVYFPNNSIDMVFIDGDHAYESVKQDIEVWHKKLKRKGILSGHDYNNIDVKRAVDEFAQSKQLQIKTGGNCFAFIKNE